MLIDNTKDDGGEKKIEEYQHSRYTVLEQITFLPYILVQSFSIQKTQDVTETIEAG